MKLNENTDNLNPAQRLQNVGAQNNDGSVKLFGAIALESVNAGQDGLSVYPRFTGVASSWNAELVEALCASCAAQARQAGLRAVTTPDLSVKTHPYKKAMTEDPFLAGRLAAAFAKGIARSGAAPLLYCGAAEDEQAGFADLVADNGFIDGFIVRPFETAQKHFASSKVITSLPVQEEGLADIRLSLTEQTTSLARQAVQESTVLLKNSGRILPLDGNLRVAVMGSSPDSRLVSTVRDRRGKLPFQYTGYAEGYRQSGERCDSLIEDARSLASQSDAVLLFLDFPKDAEEKISVTRQVKLPANRLALIDALSQSGKKIIAVLSGGIAPDMSFDADCAAVLLMPEGGAFAADALIGILSGEVNPSGRLAYSLTDGTDDYYGELKKHKDAGKIKIGRFIGYRHFDAAGVKVKYPFGHGLGYTQFSYSGIKTNGARVVFKLKNTGSRAGVETVQVYAGKNRSNAVRPVKELLAFERVFLEAGESKAVEIFIDYNDFGLYNQAFGRRVVEGGEYYIHIGASAADIRLMSSTFVEGGSLPKSKEQLSDYIHTQSNIESGGYMLKTVPHKKRLSGGQRLAAGLVAVTLLYDIFVFTLGATLELGLFFGILFIALNAIVVAVAVAMIIGNHKNKSGRLEEVACTEELGAGDTPLSDEPPFERLFTEAFAGAEAKVPQAAGETAEQSDTGAAVITAKCASEKLIAFMAQAGLALSASSARSVLSSMCASRMLLLRCAPALEDGFIESLCSFFGTGADTVLDTAIAAAASNKRLIRFAVLDTADISVAPQTLMQLAAYSVYPDREYKIPLSSSNGVVKQTAIPANLWLILRCGSTPYLDGIPPYIANAAAITDVKVQKADPTAQQAQEPLNFGSLLWMIGNSLAGYSLSEDRWKRLDKLEEFVNARAPYAVDNKTWQGIERYTSVSLACGASEAEALDGVIAARLMAEIMPLIKENPREDDGSLVFTLEKILGEDDAAASSEAVKYFSPIIQNT